MEDTRALNKITYFLRKCLQKFFNTELSIEGIAGGGVTENLCGK
jgi:hypothetical protein